MAACSSAAIPTETSSSSAPTTSSRLSFRDVGYTEVIAVSLAARGTLVQVEESEVSLEELMLYTIFKQMHALNRHPRTFVRVDRRNRRSLALCDRVGPTEERPPTLIPSFWSSVGASCRRLPDKIHRPFSCSRRAGPVAPPAVTGSRSLRPVDLPGRIVSM